MKFCFVNPLDMTLMRFSTRQEAEESARHYIGKENAWDETVTSITIYEMQAVGTVTK
jgi:hypothetical protein